MPVKSSSGVGLGSRNEPLQATTEGMKTMFDDQEADELAIIYSVTGHSSTRYFKLGVFDCFHK